ncbi:MAG: M23 family metallopeptidase [Pseudonocardiaceae bacterium]
MAAALAASALVPLSQPVAGAEPAVGDIARVAYSRGPIAAPELLPPERRLSNPATEVAELERAEQAREERQREEAAAKKRAAEKRAAAKREAARPDFARPAEGRFTSGFGARWGSSHNGVDIANSIGTPIVSVAEGEVIEAGPASGFGLWVQVRHSDGTVTVYGHMNEIVVSQGQQVKAGEEIATIGNRGQSTGPHVHFEVWQDGGTKIDPVPWLTSRGVSL